MGVLSVSGRVIYKPDHSIFSDLRSVDWQLVTDVPGRPVGSIFKAPAVQVVFLECLDFEDGTNVTLKRS